MAEAQQGSIRRDVIDQKKIDDATHKAASAKRDPKTFTSPAPVHVDGVYYKPGEPFTTSAIPGDEWNEVKPITAAAADAASKTKRSDPNYDAMTPTQLKAALAAKGVQVPAGVTEQKDLVALIKAADEPAL